MLITTMNKTNLYRNTSSVANKMCQMMSHLIQQNAFRNKNLISQKLY